MDDDEQNNGDVFKIIIKKTYVNFLIMRTWLWYKAYQDSIFGQNPCSI